MEAVKASGRPCMIITDCEDSIYLHCDKAFIMSVEPHIGSSPGMRKMVKSKNVIVYYKGKLERPIKDGNNYYMHPSMLKEKTEYA